MRDAHPVYVPPGSNAPLSTMSLIFYRMYQLSAGSGQEPERSRQWAPTKAHFTVFTPDSIIECCRLASSCREPGQLMHHAVLHAAVDIGPAFLQSVPAVVVRKPPPAGAKQDLEHPR